MEREKKTKRAGGYKNESRGREKKKRRKSGSGGRGSEKMGLKGKRNVREGH